MDENFKKLGKFLNDVDLKVESEQDLINTESIIIQQIPKITLPNQFYYVINNYTKECVYVSDSLTELTGYTPDEWTYERAFKSIHPEDQPFVDKTLYACFKMTMAPQALYRPIKDALIVNYRIKHKDGHYIHILRHGYISSMNASNQMVHNTSMCMVISDFKFDNRQTMLMKKGNKVLVELHSEKQEGIDWNILSKREKQIVELLCLNKTSDQISEQLFISKHTVDTHRRKILKKLNIQNTTELLFKSIYKSA